MLRPRGDEGGLNVDVAVVGVLAFFVTTLIIANAWAVVDTKLAVTAAAREAARAYVEAPDAATAGGAAERAAHAAMAGHRRDSSGLQVDLGGQPFERCARIVVTTSSDVPILALPSRAAGSITVSATHSELVDAFRSGVDSGDPEQGALVDECAP